MSHRDWSHKASFIFDWDRRRQEFSLFRVTKEVIGDPAKHQIPRLLRYLGSSELKECIDPGNEFIPSLKTGRWHWRGEVSVSYDYEGDCEEEWYGKLTRIR